MTPTKYQKLLQLISSEYNETNIKLERRKTSPKHFDIPNIKSKIYLYKYQSDYILKNCQTVEIIYESNNKYYNLIIYNIGIEIYEKQYEENRHHENIVIKQLFDHYIGWQAEQPGGDLYLKQKIYFISVYIDVNEIKYPYYLLKNPYRERIDMDFKFDVYNEEEIELFCNDKILNLLKFDKYYDNFDFWNKIDPDSKQIKLNVGSFNNYEIDIEFFDGTSYNDKSIEYDWEDKDFTADNKMECLKEIGSECYKLLYDDCLSSVIYVNCEVDYLYLIFLQKDNKYIRILSRSIGYGCAGRVYKLRSQMYNSFEQMWSDTKEWMKICILENILK